MQNKSFLTPVLLFLCLIVLTVIGLGVVTAIDRQRFQTEALTKAVSELSDRIDLLQSRGVAVAAGGGAVTVILTVAYLPDPSSASAFTVHSPALRPVSVPSEDIFAQAAPDVTDQFTFLFAASAGFTVAVSFIVLPA